MKLLLAILAAATILPAHVGSPDVFFEGEAGPYRLLVTIRPPQIIPGVADIEIRCATPGVKQVHIVPLRMTGPASQLAPAPDLARPAKEDPQFYTGTLWLMATGSWKVRVDVDGDQGRGSLAVPVPALSARVLTMQKTTVLILAPLGLLLAIGIVSIAGAGAREAVLEPGRLPDAAARRSSWRAMAIAAVLVGAIAWLGNQWWDSEAGFYRRYVFKPLQLQPSLEAGGWLSLRLADPGWLNRRTDDLLLDHGHLMHLYVLRIPEMELVWHLHPERASDGSFRQPLPRVPAGRYALYGDIVHANGLPETATAEMDLPEISGAPLTGDDAAGEGPPRTKADYNRKVALLPDGLRMVWDRGPEALHARRAYQFRFRLEDSGGNPASGVEFYMGMLGHAAFVAADRSVFAHVHPSGSVPMPAMQLANRADPHAGHTMSAEGAGLPAEVSFPYGFPKPGAYRLFVQMKRAGQVVTGVFDALVLGPPDSSLPLPGGRGSVTLPSHDRQGVDPMVADLASGELIRDIHP